MKGKCKYCGAQLPDIANIRCDKCDTAWREGRESGKEELLQDIRRAFGFLKGILCD